MPYTRKLDERHSVTIRSDQPSRGVWVAEGEIFKTAEPGCDLGKIVHGEGKTMQVAEQQAFDAARRSPKLSEARLRMASAAHTRRSRSFTGNNFSIDR